MMKKISFLQTVRWSSGLCILLLALGLSSFAPILYAQDLLPELAGPAAKHKAADEALDKQKTEAIALATKPYLSALDAIEKSATAKGELEVVAAVVKEREAAVAGTLDPELPAALPKMKLQGTRKALLTKLEQLNADFTRREKQTEAEYLRFLASLQTKAASNPELAKQLAAEKAALLEAAAAASSDNRTPAKKKPVKNMIINGDFEKVVDGKPDGWWGDKFTLVTEKGNTFARTDVKSINRDGSADSVSIGQKTHYSIPEKAEKIVISVKIRTQNLTADPAKAYYWPSVHISLLDDKNKEIKVHQVQAREFKNGSWKEFGGERLIPVGSVSMAIRLITGLWPGQVDFDDVEVTFK